MTSIVQNPEYLTPPIHSEFWGILEKAGPISQADFQNIRDLIMAFSIDYQRRFYEDALLSIKKGHAFKSSGRSRFEEKLVASGLLTKNQIAKDDSDMEKVAANKPISVQGVNVVFNEALIEEFLDNLAAVAESLDRVFARPD